jgi:hypothetical protein
MFRLAASGRRQRMLNAGNEGMKRPVCSRQWRRDHDGKLHRRRPVISQAERKTSGGQPICPPGRPCKLPGDKAHSRHVAFAATARHR